MLEAPFTSVADVGARHYWFVPVRLFMKDKFRSDLLAGKVTAPVLVVHCDEDTVVPITLGERLYAKIQAPSTSCVLPAAGIAILAPVPWPRRNGSLPSLERVHAIRLL